MKSGICPEPSRLSITIIWIWLPTASGFLLKAARRLDFGFQWFNRRFDIEKRLQCIGLMAGAITMVLGKRDLDALMHFL